MLYNDENIKSIDIEIKKYKLQRWKNIGMTATGLAMTSLSLGAYLTPYLSFFKDGATSIFLLGGIFMTYHYIKEILESNNSIKSLKLYKEYLSNLERTIDPKELEEDYKAYVKTRKLNKK